MTILTVIGARPQFIKAAPVSKALRAAGICELLVHTGQHYDYVMSQIFFDELSIPQPDINLGVGSGSHGKQTGEMLARIEEVITSHRPTLVAVYGDTNSTLAGAVAAAKLHVPVVHVEAGLRSFNRTMPEEINRILTDHCADLLLCPTQTAVDNLMREGIIQGVHLVGDTMYDATIQFGEVARQRLHILDRYGLHPKAYLLATIHRPSNTDDPVRLRNIVTAFIECGEPMIFPIHPRTRKRLTEYDLLDKILASQRVQVIDPVGYLDMLMLEQHARKILTDSGGVQKEAYFFAVPCITLRGETEWIETVRSGWNTLVDADINQILTAIHQPAPTEPRPLVYGNGRAAEKCVEHIRRFLNRR